MRATVSGRYDLSGLSALMWLGGPGDYDREPRFTSGAWRFTAVQLGGVEALLAAMHEALSPAARADAIQRARFVDAVVATRTAHLWVKKAALCAQAEVEEAGDIARTVRGVVERAALDVMELAARATGTRSAFDGERLDKITRDLSLYLRQAGPDYAKDVAASAWLERDLWDDDPLCRSAWKSARWLVIAPHADDETIGAGALIAQSWRNGCLGGVVILTDGAASHAHSDDRSRARLIAARRTEARAAVRRLASFKAPPPIFLDWPDASPPSSLDPLFQSTAQKLAWICRRLRIDAIAATAPHEPHCDHAAAAALARAAAKRAMRRVEVFDYWVWAEPQPHVGIGYNTSVLPAGRRAAALSSHRSQRTPAFGSGFCLGQGRELRAFSDRLRRSRERHG
ncbi:hypothetical protein LTR94_026257 [Friedmanniomyces endolithicus]|nr:hypothetical protein LTR94_026257 [Friedmanniomyces endolithicus]